MQAVLNIGLGWLTRLVPAAVRAFGSSAEKAAAKGAELNEQILYAGTSAALSYGIENVCNVAYSKLKIIAPGISDDLVTKGVEKLAQKLAKTPEGANALKNIGMVAVSGFSEGIEEAVESLIDPILQRLTYDKNAETVFQNPDLLADAATEAGQEVLQEGVTIAGTQIGSKLDTGEWAYSAHEVADRLLDTTTNSLMAFGLTNVPAAGNNIYVQSHAKLAAEGYAKLRSGEMPNEAQLHAMGLSEPEALGMIVLFQMDNVDDADNGIITDGSHLQDGQLTPNVTYKTGEHDYIYKTNEDGLIYQVVVDELQFKTHDGRLDHNPRTYGKQDGDHAGHLIRDRFGGSPELDNLVSQAKHVNLSEYRLIENQWATALENGHKVSVQIDVKYDAGNSRPTSFVVSYEIDGAFYQKKLKTNGGA